MSSPWVEFAYDAIPLSCARAIRGGGAPVGDVAIAEGREEPMKFIPKTQTLSGADEQAPSFSPLDVLRMAAIAEEREQDARLREKQAQKFSLDVQTATIRALTARAQRAEIRFRRFLWWFGTIASVYTLAVLWMVAR